MYKKASERKKPVENSALNNNADVVLFDRGNRYVSQTFHPVVSIYYYASKEYGILHAFMITLFDSKCRIIFINAGGCIQRVLGGTGEESTLKVDRIPNLSKGLILFYCINMVSTFIENKTISVKQICRYGNIFLWFTGYAPHG